MVSSDGTTSWNFDFTNAKRQLLTAVNSIDREVDRLGAKWQKTKLTIKQEAIGIIGTINALVGVMQTVIDQLGIVLGPLEDFFLQIIQTTVTTMANMAVAAGSTIIGAPLAVTIAAAGGIFSIVATAGALAGISDAKESWQKASSIAGSFGALSSSLRWMGG